MARRSPTKPTKRARALPSRRRGRRSPGSRLRSLFRAVHAYAKKKSRRTPPLSLRVGCAAILGRRRAGDPRALFEVGHIKGQVCTVAVAAKLSDEHLVGLMLHEFGHPMSIAAWGSPEQKDADEAVERFLGVRISYSGPLLLQRVSKKTVSKILGHRP